MPEKRPRWQQLSRNELEQQRASLLDKVRQLSARLKHSEAAVQRHPDPGRQRSVEVLRQQIETMRDTARTLSHRAQARR